MIFPPVTRCEPQNKISPECQWLPQPLEDRCLLPLSSRIVDRIRRIGFFPRFANRYQGLFFSPRSRGQTTAEFLQAARAGRNTRFDRKSHLGPNEHKTIDSGEACQGIGRDPFRPPIGPDFLGENASSFRKQSPSGFWRAALCRYQEAAGKETLSGGPGLPLQSGDRGRFPPSGLGGKKYAALHQKPCRTI